MIGVIIEDIRIRTIDLEEKGPAYNVLCRFTAKLKGGLYSWIDEVDNTLIVCLTLDFTKKLEWISLPP